MRCRNCGCTNLIPCIFEDESTCAWVEDDLCSACAYEPPADAAGFAFDEQSGLYLPDQGRAW